MAIANGTIRQDVWSTIKTGLGTYLGTTNYTFTSAYIDNPKTSFNDQVVIKPVTVSEEQLVLNGSRKNQPINIEIEIYSKKNQTIDVLSDGINAWFSTNEGTLYDLGLTNMDYFDNPSGDIIDLNQQKLHTKTIAVEFERTRV